MSAFYRRALHVLRPYGLVPWYIFLLLAVATSSTATELSTPAWYWVAPGAFLTLAVVEFVRHGWFETELVITVTVAPCATCTPNETRRAAGLQELPDRGERRPL